MIYIGLFAAMARVDCCHEAARTPLKRILIDIVGVFCPDAPLATENVKGNCVSVPSPEAITAEVLNCKTPEI